MNVTLQGIIMGFLRFPVLDPRVRNIKSYLIQVLLKDL
jgi:hypothetical protein